MLQKFIQHGDNRNARLHTQLVARRLNRLQPASDNSLQLRERTRRAMLWALKDLPVRNEVGVCVCVCVCVLHQFASLTAAPRVI